MKFVRISQHESLTMFSHEHLLCLHAEGTFDGVCLKLAPFAADFAIFASLHILCTAMVVASIGGIIRLESITRLGRRR
jgi:hypothetical protein